MTTYWEQFLQELVAFKICDEDGCRVRIQDCSLLRILQLFYMYLEKAGKFGDSDSGEKI